MTSANSYFKANPGLLEPVCLLLIIFSGVLDYLSGFELYVDFLYLIPLGVWAWYGSSFRCHLAAGLAAVVGQLSNEMAGMPQSNLFITIWNDLAHLLVFLCFVYLLRQLKLLLRRAEGKAERDFLTGLLNRRGLEERLNVELARASRNGRGLALGYIDLDHFKLVNDTLGHSEGDRLLYTLSSSLESSLRVSDVAARIGGDEFVVILPDCGQEDSQIVAARIVESFEQKSQRNGWPVTASLGMVYVPSEEVGHVNFSSLLSLADESLYQAKESGRNCFVYRAIPACESR